MALEWPNGKRLAVTVSVMVEAWSEGKAPGYGPQTVSVKPGVIDHARIAWGRYGPEVGAWRLLRLLNNHHISATFAASGRILELYPELIYTAERTGHCIAAHAYAQDNNLVYLSPEEQRAIVRRTVSIFERVLGRKPEGWMGPAAGHTPETAAILAGEGFAWHVDAQDADLPRIIQTSDGVIVDIPTSDFVDNRVLHGSPMDLWDVYRETFDYLYRQEPGSMLSLLFHSHSGGRPLYAAMLEKILHHCGQFPDVWFARHAELAKWAVDNKVEGPRIYAARFFDAPS